MKFGNKLITGLALGAGVFFLGSCGSAPNDQGVSFTFLGFYLDPPPSGCTTSLTPVSVVTAPITGSGDGYNPPSVNQGDVVADPQFQQPTDPDAPVEYLGLETGIPITLGVQNNLDGQFVRAQRAFINYFIEGASAQPPSTSVPFNGVVGPSSNSGAGGGGTAGSSGSAGTTTAGDAATTTATRASTLPGTFTCSTLFSRVRVLPAEVRTWISQNRGSLPEPPFTLVASVEIQGITSAGDVLTSNPSDIAINVTPDLVIPPTDGGDIPDPATSGAAGSADTTAADTSGTTSTGGI